MFKSREEKELYELQFQHNDLLERWTFLEWENKKLKKEKELSNSKSNWMHNWDECIGKVDENGHIFISKETIESTTVCISQEELLEVRKEYETPFDWVVENFDSHHCCDGDREGETYKIL